MLDQNQMKQNVAKSAISFVQDDMLVGVGTGSTVKYFIEELALIKHKISGAVSSSEQTTALLKSYSIPVYDLNSVTQVDVYIDGADEVTQFGQMIKGGGAALTREKIVMACSKKMVCIVDESKLVPYLGKFPLPVEVIPMARSFVAREIVKLGGIPNWRNGVVTDNGNWIIDIHGFTMENPIILEESINNIVGVVSNGIFAKKSANYVLIAKFNGNIETLTI
jgi:ribose 5-phosphate isomerase A